MNDYYRRLFHYDAWATGRVIDTFELQDVSDGRLIELLSHILNSKRLWRARIREENTTTIAIWPQFTLAQCRHVFCEVEQEWRGLLDEHDEAWSLHAVRYRNTKGQEYTSTIADIFLHLSHHAAYHRGQIAVHMRNLGLVPVNNDYITYAREDYGRGCSSAGTDDLARR